MVGPQRDDDAALVLIASVLSLGGGRGGFVAVWPRRLAALFPLVGLKREDP